MLHSGSLYPRLVNSCSKTSNMSPILSTPWRRVATSCARASSTRSSFSSSGPRPTETGHLPTFGADIDVVTSAAPPILSFFPFLETLGPSLSFVYSTRMFLSSASNRLLVQSFATARSRALRAFLFEVPTSQNSRAASALEQTRLGCPPGSCSRTIKQTWASELNEEARRAYLCLRDFEVSQAILDPSFEIRPNSLLIAQRP
jgi:hypothetical protein